MDFKSKLLNDAVEQMSSLPGIGKRSALRLVLHLLDQTEKDVKDFSSAFVNLKEHLNFCEKCFHITENKICDICSNSSRSDDLICVVQDIRDLLAIESTEQFYGTYHVIGGVISPMEGISPSDLSIDSLIDRVKSNKIEEIILALSTTMEGETTNFYLYKKLIPFNLKITTMSRGVSIGDELEYTDEITLGRSLVNRQLFENTLQK